ncbi:MAG TPA: cytochrome c [Candidatus Dormibacteraeota bacterium]|nr:cytochrome c [Candidatus Dormibacteraeota bacterium]
MTKTTVAITFLLVLSVVGVGHAQRGKLKEGVLSADSFFKDVPVLDHARANPYAGLAQAAAAGKKLFRRHCAECHGDTAHGTERAPSLHSPRIQSATPGDLNWFILNGNLRAGMPSWSGLPEQRRWQIITYLKSSQK